MQRQPIQSCITGLRKIWNGIQSPLSRDIFQTAILGGLGAVPGPKALIEGTPLAGDSLLVPVIAGLAGILGLTAGILYRHMHHSEERIRSRAQNAEAELRALLMMTDEAVLVVEPDGIVRTANPASEEIFNRSVDQFPGMPLDELIGQPLCLAELTKNGPVNFETTAKRAGGDFSGVEMLLSPVEFDGTKSYVALIHEPKATTQDACGTAPAARDLSEPVEKFTHDLNNELTTIMGNLSLILMSSPSDPANHERLIGAKRTAARAHALSRDLQALASGEEAELRTAELTPATMPTIVRMPAPNTSLPDTPVPSGKSAAPQKPRILILDDEEAICALLVTALNAMGFEVTEATSVRLALKACETALGEGKPFDLVISDLSLPGEMSGKDAVARIRAFIPGVKAILSSGYDADPIMSDCRNHGFDGAIAKPYDIAKLARIVRETLAGGGEAILKSA